MREHQIVINLKREQFEEVQRLARLAGSKSVAAYLKEHVLEQLLQQNESSESAVPSAQELSEINNELARMHRELQVFIAESMSNNVFYSDEGDENKLDDEIYYAHKGIQEALEDDLEAYRAQDSDTAYGDDTPDSSPIDPYAFVTVPTRRSTIKQPPPFTLHGTNTPSYNSHQSDDDWSSSPDVDEDQPVYIQPDSDQQYETLSPGRYQKLAPSVPSIDAETPSPLPPRHQTPSSNADSDRSGKGTAALSQIYHSPVDIPDAITPGAWSGGVSSSSAGMYSIGSPESIWLTPPDQVLTPGYQNDGFSPDGKSSGAPSSPSAQTPTINPTVQSGRDNQSGGATGGKHDQVGVADDELENLAERAFAISPRLGAIDKPSTAPAGFRRRQVDDPLDDLIDDKIMEEAEKLRLSSIEEVENSVVYAFDSVDTEEANAISQDQNKTGKTVSLSQSEDTQSLTNDLALQLQVQSQNSSSQPQTSDPDPTYAIDQTTSTGSVATAPAAQTEDQPVETAAGGNFATDAQASDDPPDLQDADSAPPPPAPSLEDPPPPPAPRPDSGTLTGPPPKRRRLPEDQSSDDDERISGGPPPKRRKR